MIQVKAVREMRSYGISMGSISASDSTETAVRKWLNRLSRSGGFASRLAIGLPLLGGLLLLEQSWMLAHILHASIIDGARLTNLAPFAAMFAGTLVLRAGLSIASDISATTASERIKLGLRKDLVGTILGMPPTWSGARSSGALSTLGVEQVEAMDGYLTRYVPAMLQATILPLAFAIVLLPIDWMVTLILLVTAPLIPVFMALAGLGAEAASKRQASALSRLGGYFADRLRGLTTLKLFGREAAETAGVLRASEELRNRTMRVMRIAFLSSAVLEFFAALGVAGVALYVGLTFLHLVTLRAAPLTLEAGLFCLLMAPEIYQPLRLLAAHYHDRAAAKAAVAEIATQLGTFPSRMRPLPVGAGLVHRMGAAGLTFTNVGVDAPNGRSVLEMINLVVATEEHVAIVGPSGSGKSTLLEAIAGLRPYRGSLALDGLDVASRDADALHGRIGMLGQRPTIFAGSIADNIRLARRTACDTAVQLAARQSMVMDFAGGLPEGLSTMLGEGGLGLSGGEAHRIALARLYLRNPGLLLLDEPTAHLDAGTEAAVLDGLLDFARGRTMIIATHSAAVAARMHRCLEIVGGRLQPAPRPINQPSQQRAAA